MTNMSSRTTLKEEMLLYNNLSTRTKNKNGKLQKLSSKLKYSDNTISNTDLETNNTSKTYKEFKGTFYKTIKPSGKIIKIKNDNLLFHTIGNLNSTRSMSKDSKPLKTILHTKDIKIEEDLFKKQYENTLINSGFFTRKYKLYTDTLIKTAEVKKHQKVTKNVKNTTTLDFRRKIEEYLENMKKLKLSKEGESNYQFRFDQKKEKKEIGKKFVEIKENTQFSKTIDHIYRTVNIKNQKNSDIKTERIANLLNTEATDSALNNALLRTHNNTANLTTHINESEEIENVLTEDNNILTENLNSKFLVTEPQIKDNFFISKMLINFSIFSRGTDGKTVQKMNKTNYGKPFK